MPETKTCPKCDAELPPDAPAGICPKCLMQAGLASEQDAGSAPEMKPTTLTSGFVPPDPEDLAKHFPQLEILELLGKGGMGAVYKARQPGLDRLVAVKILPPEISRDPAFTERFQREARALARLSHPHIVAVYDFGVVAQASLCYIVMEFVDGANLRQAIRTGKLTSAEALAIVPQICEALQFAHDEGIVHRDIKPENILIDKRGRVKIADFGLAKLLGQDASDHSLTATHQVMGTLRYMAPEQMQGSREVDHRADIYSLGVVFYELLTGELPMGKFAPPSKRVQVDVRLDEIVLRALEADPEHRYQHASEVKTEIDTIRTTPAQPRISAERRDPLDGSREMARFAMTPNGLPLGTIASLLLKLFFIAGVALALTHVGQIVLWTKENTGYVYEAGVLKNIIPPDPADRPLSTFIWIDVLVASAICFFIGRAAWRRIACGATPNERRGEKTGAGQVSLPGPHLVQAPADCLLLAAGVAFVTACGVALWVGVPARLGRDVTNFTNPMIRGNLIGMSIGLAIYSVLVGVAGVMLRRLRARLVVLLVAVIVGLFFPAVVALNVVMEFRNIPVWAVVIPLWLGMPAALWVVIRLFRDDVRGAFDAAAEQRRLRDFSQPPPPTLGITSEPRLSRFALWGAILTVLSVLAFLGVVFVGTVVCNHLFVTYYHPIVIPLGVSIAEWLLGTLGALASIGAPLCGAAAISQIKKSNGKLGGLPLARGCVLCSPLLVLGGITITLTHLACIAVWTNWPGPTADLTADTPPAGFPGYAFMVLDAIAAIVVCFFVGRAMWRAIAAGVAGVESSRPQALASQQPAAGGWQTRPQPQPENPPNGIGQYSLWTAMAGVVLPILLALGAQLMAPPERLSDFFILCVVLGGLLELVALGCGIVAWRTGSGKAGTLIAGVSLLLGLLIAWTSAGFSDSFEVEESIEKTAGGVVPVTRTPKAAAAESPLTIEELFTLKGHTGYVYNVRFSPDGTRIASASHDGTAKVWNAETGEELFTCRGHTDYVHGLAYSPDGTRLATTSQDGSVRIWDAATGEEKLRVTDRGVSNLVFSPDGERVVSAGNQNKVMVWNSATGKEILTLKGDDNSVFFNVAYSPDGKWIAGSGMDGSVWLWDAATGREADIHRNAISIMRGLAFDRESTRLAACSADGHVRVWDVLTGELLFLVKLDGDAPLSVTFSPDGKWLANGTTNGDIRIWHATQEAPAYMSGHYREALTIKAHPRLVKSVVFNHDGTRLASGSDDKTVKVWKFTPKEGRTNAAVTKPLDTDSSDAIHRAASRGDVVRVKQLLDAGASVNAKDADGQTLLMKAVAGGHRSLAITLVLLGADLTEQDQHGLTALMIAATQRDHAFLGKLSELSQLSYEQDTQKRQEKLRAFPGVDRALIAGSDIDRQGLGLHDAELLKDDRGENALMKAARAGDWECFNLLANQVDSLLARDKLGQTVLMHAVLGGHAEQSDWFENDGWLTKPPYYGMAGTSNVFIGRMLIFELERSLSLLDNDGKSVLQLADEHGHKEIAGILRRHLEAIIANQTVAIEKGGEGVPAHYRLRSLAWRALGQKEKAESDLKQSTPK